ncbi:tetratricopeptide repeat protein [Geopsychrobacter electrodiphilus]|uniref:tetratricopeptide repeat protein n=1 Tax=Geopsychrobacter electrodiphilus TaxID=225196 RepID=UPI0003694C41|nr:tetratricopeptide repeat protein [Geopsychrobacter electrodiphilus]
MQRPFQILRSPIMLVLFALLMQTGGCATPQASNGLQQRIDELIKVQQQQAQQLAQLTQQLTSLQPQAATPALQTPVPSSQVKEPTQLQAPKVIATTEPAPISEAAELYMEAFAAIATGQMAEAESGFRTFIQRFPDHEYLANANYWLAEALLAQHKTKDGETLLLKIIDTPTEQQKAPAAMARLVSYYHEINDQDKAAAMLQMLSTNYPESPELKRLMRSTDTR